MFLGRTLGKIEWSHWTYTAIWLYPFWFFTSSTSSIKTQGQDSNENFSFSKWILKIEIPWVGGREGCCKLDSVFLLFRRSCYSFRPSCLCCGESKINIASTFQYSSADLNQTFLCWGTIQDYVIRMKLLEIFLFWKACLENETNIWQPDESKIWPTLSNIWEVIQLSGS